MKTILAATLIALLILTACAQKETPPPAQDTSVPNQPAATEPTAGQTAVDAPDVIADDEVQLGELI